MSVLRDSHTGIVPTTIVYVNTFIAICSFFHEFLSTVRGLPYRVHWEGDAKPQSISDMSRV